MNWHLLWHARQINKDNINLLKKENEYDRMCINNNEVKPEKITCMSTQIATTPVVKEAKKLENVFDKWMK